jgi:ribosome-binding ATPase YchF (GTP1/OBG family)
MPNVGKSTLFNALVKQQLAQAANFPFCTIDPQSAVVEVPDARLKMLAAITKSAAVIGHQIEFVDIAGLIAGASKGEGLGNAFLGHVRAVNALLQVVRCFDDEEIIHVLNHADPLRDIAIIENELLLADLQSIEKRLAGGAGKRGAAKTPEAEITQRLLTTAEKVLSAGLPARVMTQSLEAAERAIWPRLQLLTQKPMLYVCNVADTDAKTGNTMTRAVAAHVRAQRAAHATLYAETIGSAGATGGAVPASPGGQAATGAAGAPQGAAGGAAGESDEDDDVCVVCAKLEAETALLADEVERADFLSAYGLSESGLDKVTRKSSRLLGMQTYYTTGPQETRAWSIPVGSTAQEAAAAIHTDIARGFIRAEITSLEDYRAAGGEKGARDAGKTRAEGKDYRMRDGDIVLFRHAGGGNK